MTPINKGISFRLLALPSPIGMVNLIIENKKDKVPNKIEKRRFLAMELANSLFITKSL